MIQHRLGRGLARFFVMLTLVLPLVRVAPAVAQEGAATLVAAQESATPDAASASTDAVGWPMFRANPQHTGTASGPGPVGTPGVLWRVETGGGQPSPAVVDGVVYVASEANYFWALDAATGEERWRIPATAGVGTAPAVDEGLVVVGTFEGLFALDATTGEERWRIPAGEETANFGWSSPALADGVIYATDSDAGILHALDAATGEERWRLEEGVRLTSTPAVADGVVYFATEPVFGGADVPAAVIAVDAATGQETWRTEVDIEGDTFFSSPAVVDGGLYIGSQNPEGPGALRAFDIATGEERWRFEVPHHPVFSSPAVADGVVYVGGNGLYAVDAASGELRWRVGMGEVWSSPAVVDGVVYVGGEEGYLIAADAVTGEELWTVEIGGGGLPFRHSSPAVAAGTIYIQGSDSYFYAVGDAGAAGTPTAGAAETLDAAEGPSFADLGPELLMEATFPADLLPPAPAYADVFVLSWPAGVSYRYEEDAPGVSVTCVMTGQWAYSLIEPAAAGTTETGTPVAMATPGTETTLNAGECATLAANAHRDERNPGSEPLELLHVVVWPEDFYGLGGVPPEIAVTFHSVFMPTGQWGALPPGPVDVAVQRASLAPDGVIAPYAGEGLGKIGTIYEPTTHLSQRVDGSVRNLGDATLDVLLFTAQAAGQASETGDTPTAAEAEASSVAADGPAAFLWQTSGGPVPFGVSIDVTVDPEGNVWVPDGANDRFQIFAPDGAFRETWGVAGSDDGEFDFTRANGEGLASIAFDSQGNFFVTDLGNRRIQKFDRDRQFVTAWGEFGTGDGQFVDPIFLAVDGDGNVYVTDDRRDDIQKFDNDGNYLTTFAGHGSAPGQILFTGGSAIDAAGNLYVADFGNNRVQKLAPDGSFLMEWGSLGDGPGEFNELNHVAVDAAGNVYVADSGNHRVQVFDADGQYLTEWGSQGSDPEQFNFPVDIALDGQGNLYVADVDNHRIQKFRLQPLPAPADAATPTT